MLPLPCVQQGDASQGRQSQQESCGCALRAHVRPSLHVVHVGVRLQSSTFVAPCHVGLLLGAQAVTWLHNQCAWRVKHSWAHFLTDSLCVLSRLAQRFLYFHFWLFLCVGCRFCFVSVLVRIDSTLVVVSSIWKCTVIVDVCLP